jgi:hypothetical protein
MPVMVTVVPDCDGDGGDAEAVTDVHGVPNVNLSLADVALVPAAVVTVTSTCPAACAGLTAVIWVSETIITLVARAVPKWTAKPVLLNWVPVMVTVVPPDMEPPVGDTPVTVGTVH